MNADHLNIVFDLDRTDPASPLSPALAKLLYDLREQLPMFVVYDRPSDFPEHVVARLWTTFPERPIRLIAKAEKVEAIRVFLDGCGLVHLDRQPGDHPSILETWL